MAGYLGSKAASGSYQAIISRMAPHDTYIETHLGGGAVMLNKPPALRNIGVDIDEHALGYFETIHNKEASRVELIQADAVNYLRYFDFSTAGRVQLYCDPPYLPCTRTSRARYRHEYTEKDHVDLLKILRLLPDNVNIILSGYPSRMYDDLLPGWRTHEYQSMTRGGVRTEKLWMNFSEGAVYSHQFAGKNYIDRQRIKRKAERWARNYKALPPDEQLAIMAALSNYDEY
ncbi:DNA adenine methylase [Limnobaculum xujianqingii]|uniref:DNA adenine methylase n=1 Tax=Limnobaculum xujianqingii TaxID=2738837 RepID=UPI001126AEC4|nr:DNA adenine methylase [Limnobaculum xujianqingii]